MIQIFEFNQNIIIIIINFLIEKLFFHFKIIYFKTRYTSEIIHYNSHRWNYWSKKKNWKIQNSRKFRKIDKKWRLEENIADPYAWSNPSLVQGINMSLTAGANIPSYPFPPHPLTPHIPRPSRQAVVLNGACVRSTVVGHVYVSNHPLSSPPPGRLCAYILTISKEVLPSRYRATGQLN